MKRYLVLDLVVVYFWFVLGALTADEWQFWRGGLPEPGLVLDAGSSLKMNAL